MTREEAKAYFKRHIDLYCVTGICRDAEEMAIKALEQQDKIAQIIDDCDLEAWEVLEMIKEVVRA